MPSVNRVEILGRLTRDPESRATSSGGQMATFSVATDRFFKHAGEQEKTADFHSCIAFDGERRKLAAQVVQHLQKGSLVYVEGRLQTRSYEAQDGQRRWSTEIVATDVQFLEGRKS